MNMSKLILPGLIDPHVHLRDPGQTQKEDFYSGTQAALAGGYTTVIDMPNNATPITTAQRLEEKIAIAAAKIVCDVGFYFGSLGDNLEEFEKVKDKTLGLKLYLNQTTGNFLLDKNNLSRVFSTFPKTLPILVHAEEKAVEDVLEVVKETGRKTHFCHVTAFELAQIIKAKQEGLPVTCGVTPHHLFLTEDDVKTLGPYGLMKPALQSKKGMEFLWQNLKSIDVIESDHAPHTINEKESDNPPYGVPGLETTLPLLLTAISEKKITIENLRRMCFENPRKIFNIKTDPETKIEIDIHKSYIINHKSLFTKCGWSPFNNRRVKGKVIRVFLRGKKVFEDGRVLASPGSGFLLPC